MQYWYDNAVFYSIYPLGAVTHKHDNDYVQSTEGMERLGDWVDHIAGLGCNAVYFAPIFESRTHGYDTTDYRKIDSRLGTNEQFAKLSRRCHEAGIKVVVDGVFNHTGRDFFAFRDIAEKRDKSQYRDWYRGVNFSGNTPLNDGFSYEAWRGHFELPRLNPHNPAVCEYLFDTVRMWVKEFDIDGIRLDCADCLDFDFMKNLRKVCTGLKSDFWLMGEVIHGDYTRWANADTLHSVTNYECSKGLYSSHNDANMHEIAYSFNRQFGPGGIYKNLKLYSFADNHDVNRVADTVQNKKHLYTIYTLLFTMPGSPSIYYGSEWGIGGVTDRITDWALRPQIDIKTVKFDDPQLMEHIKKLAHAYRNSEALQTGDYSQISVASQQLVFRRKSENDEIIVMVNADAKPVEIQVDAGGRALSGLLKEGDITRVNGGKASVTVPAYGSRILRVVSSAAIPTEAARPAVAASAPQTREQAAKPPVQPAPPPAPAPQPAPKPAAVQTPPAPVPPPPPAAPQPQGDPEGVHITWFDNIAPLEKKEHPTFEHTVRRVVDTDRCSVAFYELPPGKSMCPYHYHTAQEEVYYILTGTGLLRTAEGDKTVRAGDIIYFPAGEKGVHRLINTTHEPLRYIDFDARVPGDACVYADSRKVSLDGVVYRLGDKAGYYDGE